MQKPVVRKIVAMRDATIAGGRRLHTWNDLLGVFPGVIGVKTGHTAAAGWSEVARRARPGASPSTRRSSAARRARAQRRSRGAADLGARRATASSDGDPRRPRLRERAHASYGRRPVELVAPRSVGRAVRPGRPLVERVVAPTGVDLPVREGQALGEVRVYDRQRLVARSPLVAARLDRRQPGRCSTARGWYVERDRPQHRGAGFGSVIVTVTLNAALDRTLTVPNFQLGQRHRASGGPDARRRQGHQRRAGAQAARRAGRRDRPRRRPDRARASSRS